MTSLYVRWIVVLIVAVVLSILTFSHYQKHLATLSPSQVKTQGLTQEVRVLGMVRGGTLAGKVDAGDATFELVEDEVTIPVHYLGPPPDNLRELKTLILIGKWNPSDNIFEARDIGLVTNYGFVIGAYLIGLIPLALFLFVMSRRVGLLYEEIKASKLYQEE
ncbi:cytochrome c maturation protein CcmE [Candidatus Nitronereus thalassa]|uniref:Cytochrome c maturation protein CcmE n=1 Tax=Candidatus Nitronereus thalassa TaxID=3020898 RepID=A0ABU3K875_9BACT|nr:cytochrome c maturation protein CcmE [Candidatus Nitronereus thalassa]MDT7042576.1 cytochrome c maturation protein CcmE [Candidatus Nitronereus thalassa]